MEIHLLDVGQTKYGDCILITNGAKTILIDAAHGGDFASISAQLGEILERSPPFKIDLLVVTHCHSDHIGCMPRLVSEGVIKAVTALVADENLGFGRDPGGDSPIDAVGDPAIRKLALALQEEPADGLDDAELAVFIEDAATLEDRYIDMLSKLESAGTTVVRYHDSGQPEIAKIERDLAELGLKILGPTEEHLARCAEVIQKSVRLAADTLSQQEDFGSDATSLVNAYRLAVDKLVQIGKAGSDEFAIEDRPGVGAAKNNQSIVLRVEADGWRALLTGDMQFAEPEVDDLDPLMIELRKKVIKNVEYDFIKLSHHSSYNGLNQDVLDDWKETLCFAHTGGKRDATHPDAGVLELLESVENICFARTDNNGQITARKVGGKVRLIPARGELNDFSRNRPRRAQRDALALVAQPEAAARIVTQSAGEDTGVVELIARIPHVSTSVTVTVDINPREKKNGVVNETLTRGGNLPPRRTSKGVDGDRPFKLGGGREFKDRLLFVTNRALLQKNVGASECATALSAISATGQKLFELPDSATTVEQTVPLVRAELNRARYAGVVLVGGYDVVPSARLDVLDKSLRDTLTALGKINDDSDRFVVWSDSLYGDLDGDTVGELPVSRVPDGRHPDVLFAALSAPFDPRTVRGGIRNNNRMFASSVYEGISGNPAKEMLSSKPVYSDMLSDVDLSGDVYYMLHGSDIDGMRFWGEEAPKSLIEAFDISSVPEKAPGAVVFAGCCWGALTVRPSAAKLRVGGEIRPRGPEDSIAIAYLRAGALAFVGCTGTHYSPLKPFEGCGLDYFGKPMHAAFWRNLKSGKSPAKALFDAKVEFAQSMPHGPDDPFSRGVEMKILREFTVLGLGW